MFFREPMDGPRAIDLGYERAPHTRAIEGHSQSGETEPESFLLSVS